ncbi:MAG: 2-hydroxycyclohexanecarboxyl-CoA dehydrogenase [Gammaproteobacteria bacterium]|jgi:2-hydroxycyclohexanecarboxyl-CoA dehydrogenase
MTSDKRKVAIITGGAAGIGRACALRFAKENYHVLIVDQSEEALRDTCQTLEKESGSCTTLSGDISKESSSEAFYEKAMSLWGKIDVLVANAGVQIGGDLLDANEDDWDKILGVNLKGVAYSCKAVLPSMLTQGSGAIVIISSINAISGSAGMAIYDASKTAVLGLMRNLAISHGKQGVRVNAICPGNTLSDFHINRMAKQGVNLPQLREMTKGYGLLDRAAEPVEIANAAYFLASDEASFITGHTLLVDGGFSISNN